LDITQLTIKMNQPLLSNKEMQQKSNTQSSSPSKIFDNILSIFNSLETPLSNESIQATSPLILKEPLDQDMTVHAKLSENDWLELDSILMDLVGLYQQLQPLLNTNGDLPDGLLSATNNAPPLDQSAIQLSVNDVKNELTQWFQNVGGIQQLSNFEKNQIMEHITQIVNEQLTGKESQIFTPLKTNEKITMAFGELQPLQAISQPLQGKSDSQQIISQLLPEKSQPMQGTNQLLPMNDPVKIIGQIMQSLGLIGMDSNGIQISLQTRDNSTLNVIDSPSEGTITSFFNEYKTDNRVLEKSNYNEVKVNQALETPVSNPLGIDKQIVENSLESESKNNKVSTDYVTPRDPSEFMKKIRADEPLMSLSEAFKGEVNEDSAETQADISRLQSPNIELSKETFVQDSIEVGQKLFTMPFKVPRDSFNAPNIRDYQIDDSKITSIQGIDESPNQVLDEGGISQHAVDELQIDERAVEVVPKTLENKRNEIFVASRIEELETNLKNLEGVSVEDEHLAVTYQEEQDNPVTISEKVVEVKDPQSKDVMFMDNGMQRDSTPVRSTASTSVTAQSPPILTVSDFVPEVSEWMGRFFKVTNGKNGSSEAKFTLYPEHFGHLEIKITTQEGRISAQIITDTLQAKETLEGQLSFLKQSLQQHGLQVQRLEIIQQPLSVDMNQSNQSFSHGGSNQNFNQSQEQRSFTSAESPSKHQKEDVSKEVEKESTSQSFTYGKPPTRTASRIDFIV
jgi:flagellar hook-length control protein FliK